MSGLPRLWVTVQVPGTSSQRIASTYVAYPADALPRPPEDAADLEWLRQARRHPRDYMATAFESATRDLSTDAVVELLGDFTSMPRDFTRFVDEALRDRLRSATDSYFDLGDAAVPVDGGLLLHLISDSQWVYHWLLYVGHNGDSAVVGTTFPAGFTLDADDTGTRQTETWGYAVVADSFAEFLWRWWMDNEIFYRAHVEQEPLTPAQRTYVEQYGEPQRLG